LFGYFILDKQNKVTRQQGETMAIRVRQTIQKTLKRKNQDPSHSFGMTDASWIPANNMPE